MEKLLSLVFILIFCSFPRDTESRRHGYRSKVNDSKIVGGDDTTIQDIPYQAYLLLQQGSTYYQCGGSIISENYILTAAHCLVDGIDTVYARIGSTNANDGGTQYKTTTFKAHPKYSSVNYDYDVGIVTFANKLNLDGKDAKAIKLPESGASVPPGTILTVSGWGATSEGGNVSPTLKAVQVPVISNKECSKIYRSLTPRMICAGFPEGGKDSCQGDSGGPAASSGPLQAGIVSFGVGCARPKIPGVYTNVANKDIRKWIKDNSGI